MPAMSGSAVILSQVQSSQAAMAHQNEMSDKRSDRDMIWSTKLMLNLLSFPVGAWLVLIC